MTFLEYRRRDYRILCRGGCRWWMRYAPDEKAPAKRRPAPFYAGRALARLALPVSTSFVFLDPPSTTLPPRKEFFLT